MNIRSGQHGVAFSGIGTLAGSAWSESIASAAAAGIPARALALGQYFPVRRPPREKAAGRVINMGIFESRSPSFARSARSARRPRLQFLLQLGKQFRALRNVGCAPHQVLKTAQIL
jgi:hypothetical protein